MKPLKVYGWQGWRLAAPREANGSHQTREICAARSMAEVARIAGQRSPRSLFNLCETGNDEECAAALANPGVILWRGLDRRRDEWTAAGKAGQ